MELYKGYQIYVERTSNKKIKAVSNSDDDYVDDTEEEAIAGVKRKIDNIAILHEMQEEARRKREQNE